MKRFSLLNLILLVSLIASSAKTVRSSENVPQDILNRIVKDFGYFSEASEAQDLIERLHERSLNVGCSQYSRAILVLALGDIEKLRELAAIPEDPRDILIHATKVSTDTGQCFAMPFRDSNMEDHKGRKSSATGG